MSASPDTLGTSDAVRAELEALLGISDAALAGGVAALQDVLRDRENPEELARREMLDLVSTTAGVPFGAAADLIDPCISVELCVERGWPVRCFTACNCTGRCMKRLAIQDGGVFDELLQRLRDAHTRAEAGTDVPRAKRAQQILQGSVWRHTIEGVASPMLEALLADERAAAMEAEARASTGSVEATIVAVNAALQQRGCCKQGRLAFVGCSSDYLSYDRKRGSAGPRASTSRGKERLPVARAILADPCKLGCVPYLTAENATLYPSHSTHLFLGSPLSDNERFRVSSVRGPILRSKSRNCARSRGARNASRNGLGLGGMRLPKWVLGV